jgi:hypothetical protein
VAEAVVADAEETGIEDDERQKLRDKAARAQERAEAAKELAIVAGLEPQGLERQPAHAMPHRGLAHRADALPPRPSGTTAPRACGYPDPDSHIMKSDGAVLQGCNCQAVVDGDHQVILAMGVSNQPPDVEHLVAMLERTITSTAQVPRTLIADAGYWSEENAAACESEASTPISQRADSCTGSHHHRSLARSPRISMPKGGWPASYTKRQAARSMQGTRRRWSRRFVRSKKHEGCGASCYAGWRR